MKNWKNPYFSIWKGMVARCYNTNHASYKRYGGRGIKVCDDWLGTEGFSNFLKDLGEKPSNIHSLERIDNDGDYSKQNCKWATPEEQQNNRSDNRKIILNNKSYTIAQIAKKLGVTHRKIQRPLDDGFPIELVVSKLKVSIKNLL